MTSAQTVQAAPQTQQCCSGKLNFLPDAHSRPATAQHTVQHRVHQTVQHTLHYTCDCPASAVIEGTVSAADHAMSVCPVGRVSAAVVEHVALFLRVDQLQRHCMRCWTWWWWWWRRLRLNWCLDRCRKNGSENKNSGKDKNSTARENPLSCGTLQHPEHCI